MTHVRLHCLISVQFECLMRSVKCPGPRLRTSKCLSRSPSSFGRVRKNLCTWRITCYWKILSNTRNYEKKEYRNITRPEYVLFRCKNTDKSTFRCGKQLSFVATIFPADENVLSDSSRRCRNAYTSTFSPVCKFFYT